MSWCVLVRALASGDLQLSKSKSASYCSSYVSLELKPLVADVEYKGNFAKATTKKGSLHEIVSYPYLDDLSPLPWDLCIDHLYFTIKRHQRNIVQLCTTHEVVHNMNIC